MSKYDGEWYGMYDGFLRGTISGEMLIWGNGVGMPVSYDGEGRLLLAEFVGELNANCEIDWNDGDIWIKMDGSGKSFVIFFMVHVLPSCFSEICIKNFTLSLIRLFW